MKHERLNTPLAVTVVVNEFRSIVIQSPDNPSDRVRVPGKGPERAELALVDGVEWLLFPHHGDRGLPLHKKRDVGDLQSPTIERAWENEDVEVWLTTPDGVRKDLFDET